MGVRETNTFVILRSTLQRLPLYYCYINERLKAGDKYVSAAAMAQFLDLNPVLVRKDLESVSSVKGLSRVGFLTEALERDLRTFLGYDNVDDAILVGIGGLGHALLNYDGFSDFGLNIVAGFDSNENLHGIKVGGKPVLPLEKLENLVQRLNIRLGIITVPKEHAQKTCDLMIRSGIRAIWNFAPVTLDVRKDVFVKNENLAASFASLSRRLYRTYQKRQD